MAVLVGAPVAGTLVIEVPLVEVPPVMIVLLVMTVLLGIKVLLVITVLLVERVVEVPLVEVPKELDEDELDNEDTLDVVAAEVTTTTEVQVVVGPTGVTAG